MATPISAGSLATTRIDTFYNNVPLSIGTGFFRRWNNQVYIVTAWHVITGRNSETLKIERSDAAIPNRIEFNIGADFNNGQWMKCSIDLYEDCHETNPRKAIWLEHGHYGHRVDAVAVPINIPASGQILEIDAIADLANLFLEVSATVFVLGYPRGIDGGGNFPIWKRGSIATEPYLPLHGNLPRILIDTATREGMSGAPVIAVADGHHRREGEDTVRLDGMRHVRFIGSYSGRLGKGEMEAQLGIVWKADVILQIMQGNIRGTSSFELTSI